MSQVHVVLIDEDLNRRIDELIQYAKTHVFSKDIIEDLSNGNNQPIGDLLPQLTILIPLGYMVTFSYEHQLDDCTYKHISMSYGIDNDVDREPPPQRIAFELLSRFGFKIPNSSDDPICAYTHMWVENNIALNVVQKTMDPDFDFPDITES